MTLNYAVISPTGPNDVHRRIGSYYVPVLPERDESGRFGKVRRFRHR
jgi:hypothetical protein